MQSHALFDVSARDLTICPRLEGSDDPGKVFPHVDKRLEPTATFKDATQMDKMLR